MQREPEMCSHQWPSLYFVRLILSHRILCSGASSGPEPLQGTWLEQIYSMCCSQRGVEKEASTERQHVWLTIVCVFRLPTVWRPKIWRLMKTGRKNKNMFCLFTHTMSFVFLLRWTIIVSNMKVGFSFVPLLTRPPQFPARVERRCLMMILDVHVLPMTIWGAMVAIFSLSIFNWLLQMILHIQSSFPSLLIMDHSHLSCILNKRGRIRSWWYSTTYFISTITHSTD